MKNKQLSIVTFIWRLLSVSLILIFPTGAAGFSPVKAQTFLQFEGTIAYVDASGNIVIATGDGKQRKITTDAQIKDGIPYSRLSFSPNGKYLAFVRSDYKIQPDKLMIYDLQNDSFIGKFDYLYPASFIQWHRDSDSFILMTGEYDDSVKVGDNYLNKIYRQYLSGKKVQLGEYYEGDAGQTINFDLDTVFYTPNSTSLTGTLYNWARNTNYQIKLDDEYGVGGFWFPDGSHYVRTGVKIYSMIDLETGKIVKQINLQDVLPALSQTGIDYPHADDISPNSKHILINYNSHLYNLDLDKSTANLVYTNSDAVFHGSWSRSGNLILVNQGQAGEQNLSVLGTNNITNSIATNAAPLFWLSKSSERFVYAQYNGNNSGSEQKIGNALMLYDYANQASTKIGDLPNLKGLEIWELENNYYVAWTNAQVNLPSAPQTSSPTTPVPSNGSISVINGQPDSQAASPFWFSNISYVVACGLCLLFLLILAILIAIFLNRSRKNKRSHEKNGDRSGTPQRVSPNVAQINQAIGLAKSKRYQEAFDMFRQIVQSEPNNASAWFNLGGVLADMGNFKDF